MNISDSSKLSNTKESPKTARTIISASICNLDNQKHGINRCHTFENTSFRFDKARISWRYGRNQSGAAQKEATGVNNPGAANKLTTLAPVFFFQVRATKNVKTEEGVSMFAASDSTRKPNEKSSKRLWYKFRKVPVGK